MMDAADFTCKHCATSFYVAWEFGDEVTCPYCLRVWETDYETDAEDNISGPWLTNEVLNPSRDP